MDRRIKNHIHATDKVTCHKCLFAFAADKVNELHMTGDVVDMLIMTEAGDIKPLFVDYLLLTQHIGHALMKGIYEKTFVKKLGLTPQEI